MSAFTESKSRGTMIYKVGKT